MKKISVTIICPGEEEYPGCEDLMESYPEINLVARHSALDEAGVWAALAGTDVLLLDEAVIELEGPDKVRAIHVEHPALKTLQICEKTSENKLMGLISIGVRGVLERPSMVSMLRKAIMVLYSGEIWMSREIVQSLHNQSRRLGHASLWIAASVPPSGFDKLN